MAKVSKWIESQPDEAASALEHHAVGREMPGGALQPERGDECIPVGPGRQRTRRDCRTFRCTCGSSSNCRSCLACPATSRCRCGRQALRTECKHAEQRHFKTCARVRRVVEIAA